MSASSAMVKMPLCVTESSPFVVTCFCRVTAFPVMVMFPNFVLSEPTAPYTVMFPVPPVSDKVFSSPETDETAGTAPSVIAAPVSFPTAPVVWMVELPVSVSVFIFASEERTTGEEFVMIFPQRVLYFLPYALFRL